MPRLPIAEPLLDLAGDFDPVNLVNPYSFGGGVDADAQAYFDQIVLAGSTIGATARGAINNFVLGCKAASIWTLLKDIGPLRGDDLTGALVKLKKLSSGWSYTNHNFVGGDYSAATGLTGNGTTKYLATGVNGTDLTSNSTGIAVYDRSTANSTKNKHGAHSSSTAVFVLWAPDTDNKPYSDQYNDANEIVGSTISGTVGFIHGASSGEHTLYRNGSQVATTATVGGSLPSAEIFFFSVNSSGPDTFGTHALGFLALTAGMNSTQAAAFSSLVATLEGTR